MRSARRRTQALAGIGLLALAGGVLYLGADPSPATPQSLRLFGLWRLRHAALFLVLALGGLLAILSALNRLWLVYAAITLGTITGFSAALEVAGRAGLIDWQALLRPAAGDLDDLGTRAEPYRTAAGQTYQDTAFLLGLESAPIPFDFRADRYGYRNTPDRDAAQIILLGDSMLVGALVAAEETVSGRLDALLPQTVMQVALIGTGVQEQHALLNATGMDLAGRTLIQFVFEGNDLLDSRSYRNPPADPAAAGRGSFVNALWNLATRATGSSRDPADFDSCRIGEQLYTFLWTQRSFLDHEEEIPHVTAALESFAADVAQRGGDFRVVFVPTKFRVLSELCAFAQGSRLRDTGAHLSPLRDALAIWANSAGLPLLDLTDPLRSAARSGEIPWFWGDTHWNETGHDVAARSLADWEALAE